MSPVRTSWLVVRIGARLPVAGARQLGSWLSVKAKAFAFCMLSRIITQFGPGRKPEGCQQPGQSRLAQARCNAPLPTRIATPWTGSFCRSQGMHSVTKVRYTSGPVQM
jgi:hypothetical protein